MKILFKQI